MEIQCPQCSQRLRVSDSLKNPLLRCPRCGSTFRSENVDAPAPAEIYPSAPVTSSAVPEVFHETQPQYASPPPRMEPVAKPSHSWGKGGLSWLAMVVLFLCIKAGPRLAKNLFGERRPPQNVPVRIDPPRMDPDQMRNEQKQAFERVIRDMQQKLEQRKALREQGQNDGVPPPAEAP